MARLGIAGVGSAMGTTAVDVPRSIIDQQDELKSWPDARLIEELQAPSGTSPQFLVFSEVKRRKDVRDRYAQESVEVPGTSMVQETIMESSDPYGSEPLPPEMTEGPPMAPEQAGLGAIRGMRDGGPVGYGGPEDDERSFEDMWGSMKELGGASGSEEEFSWLDPLASVSVGDVVEGELGETAGAVASGAWDIMRPDATDLVLMAATATGAGAAVGVPAMIGRRLYKLGKLAHKYAPGAYKFSKRKLGEAVDAVTPQRWGGKPFGGPDLRRTKDKIGGVNQKTGQWRSDIPGSLYDNRLEAVGGKVLGAGLGAGGGYALGRLFTGDPKDVIHKDVLHSEENIAAGMSAAAERDDAAARDEMVRRQRDDAAAAREAAMEAAAARESGAGRSDDSGMDRLEQLIGELSVPHDRSARNAQALFEASSAFLTQPTIGKALGQAASSMGALVGDREKGDEAVRLARIKAEIGVEQMRSQERRFIAREEGLDARETARNLSWENRARTAADQRALTSTRSDAMKNPQVIGQQSILQSSDSSAEEKEEARRRLAIMYPELFGSSRMEYDPPPVGPGPLGMPGWAG